MFTPLFTILLIGTCKFSTGSPTPKNAYFLNSTLDELANKCKSPLLSKEIKGKLNDCQILMSYDTKENLAYSCLLYSDINHDLCNAVNFTKLNVTQEDLLKLPTNITLEQLCNDAKSWDLTDYSVSKQIQSVFKNNLFCITTCSTSHFNEVNYFCKYFKWGLGILEQHYKLLKSAIASNDGSQTGEEPNIGANKIEGSVSGNPQDQLNRPGEGETDTNKSSSTTLSTSQTQGKNEVDNQLRGQQTPNNGKPTTGQEEHNPSQEAINPLFDHNKPPSSGANGASAGANGASAGANGASAAANGANAATNSGTPAGGAAASGTAAGGAAASGTNGIATGDTNGVALGGSEPGASDPGTDNTGSNAADTNAVGANLAGIGAGNAAAGNNAGASNGGESNHDAGGENGPDDEDDGLDSNADYAADEQETDGHAAVSHPRQQSSNSRLPVSDDAGRNGTEFGDDEDDHFFQLFLTVVIVVIVLYILYHNKNKVSKVFLGLIVEGRQSGRRRNSRGHAYRRLDTLEQAMSSKTSAPPTKIIY